jgi:putative DNA primase/helicase
MAVACAQKQTRVAQELEEIRARRSVSGQLVPAAALEAAACDWLWENRFARGKLSLVCGSPGAAKSLLMHQIVAGVSSGLPLPGSTCAYAPAQVLGVYMEDSLDDVVVPRLMASGATMQNIRFLKLTAPTLGSKGVRHGEAVKGLVRLLEQELKRMPECKMVVIDPVNYWIFDESRELKETLLPLAQFAKRANVALVCVQHVVISEARIHIKSKFIAALLGSTARSVFMVERALGEPSHRVLYELKNNMAAGTEPIRFQIRLHEAEVAGAVQVLPKLVACEKKPELPSEGSALVNWVFGG